MPFLVWWATTGGSSKGLHALHCHSANIWLEEGASRSWSRCLLQKMPWRLSKHWSRCVWQPPFWLLLTTLIHSCWRLMHLRMDWAQCCHRSRKMGGTTLSPMATKPLHLLIKNYHSTKFECLALKWAVMEHFKEFLPYQSFLVRMDNNPLTYIMLAPNLDAMGHWWVSALAQFNFELEYQKGCGNTVADALSWVTSQLDPDMVRSILNRVTLGSTHRAKVHDPAIVEGDCYLEQEVHVTTGCALVQMHVTDWAETWKEDLMFSAVLNWLKAQKRTDLNALLVEHTSSKEGRLISQNQQNFTIHEGALYLCPKPKMRLKIFYSSWSQGPIVLAPWTGATGMQVIRGMTIPCLCYGSTSGGQAWPIRCSSLLSPACISCNIRANCQKGLYTWLWPPLHGSLACRLC